MHLIYNGLFLVAAIKWGDWKHWNKYYSTILFFIVGDLLKNFLMYNHYVWSYQETIFAENLLRNHTIISLMIMFVVYPSTALIYLARFPDGVIKRVGWVALWVFLYSGVEFVNLHYLKLIKHHNGWSMMWSIIFNIVMFSTLWVHFKKPLIAWGLSILWVIFLLIWFNVPVDSMK
jgi:hypothetical protein